MQDLTNKQQEALLHAVLTEGHRIQAQARVRNDLVRLSLGERLLPANPRSIVRLSGEGLAVAQRLAADRIAENLEAGGPDRPADEDLGICPGQGERLNVRACALVLTGAGCAPLVTPQAGGVGFRLSATDLPRTVSVDVHPIAYLGSAPGGGWPAFLDTPEAVEAEARLAAAADAALRAQRWQVFVVRSGGRVRSLRARPWGSG
ncbi:hypothetical protein ACIQF6_35790 [Kitasatospora sp. NPDC092948]|uniref:hypothetical protein n=1 Tax=Kitasatospora sp. NPDC092948 TaxID=3364088 RepID=UPI00381CFE7D